MLVWRTRSRLDQHRSDQGTLGHDAKNKRFYSRHLARPKEISDTIRKAVKASSFRHRYGNVFDGGPNWKKVKAPKARPIPGHRFDLCAQPAYFEGMTIQPKPVQEIAGARILALFGDSITTDHISPPARSRRHRPPASICRSARSPAGFQLLWRAARQSRSDDARHFRQHPNQERDDERRGGGNTIYYSPNAPSGETMSIFDAAMRYAKDGVQTVVVGGKNTAPARRATGREGTQAARHPRRGRRKLRAHPPFQPDRHGCCAVRIHRRQDARDYRFTGREAIDIPGSRARSRSHEGVATVRYPDGTTAPMPLMLMILTADEVAYFTTAASCPMC